LGDAAEWRAALADVFGLHSFNVELSRADHVWRRICSAHHALFAAGD